MDPRRWQSIYGFAFAFDFDLAVGFWLLALAFERLESSWAVEDLLAFVLTHERLELWLLSERAFRLHGEKSSDSSDWSEQDRCSCVKEDHEVDLVLIRCTHCKGGLMTRQEPEIRSAMKPKMLTSALDLQTYGGMKQRQVQHGMDVVALYRRIRFTGKIQGSAKGSVPPLSWLGQFKLASSR